MLKLLKRLVLGLSSAIIFAVLALVVVVGGDALLSAQSDVHANAMYPTADGTTLHGYLARPEEPGTYPGVLMIHEWWGLNHEITEMADALAEEGYVVLAPDTYRGAVTDLVPRAIVLRVTTPEDRVDADVQAAYDYLVSLDDVDAERTAIIGFCYGGGVALRHGIQNSAIDFVMNAYGDTDAADFGALREDDVFVFGVFGTADAQIPVTEVEAFADALADADVNHEVRLYEDMGHAFMQPDNINAPGEPGNAWRDLLNSMGESLAPDDATTEEENEDG